MSGNSGGVWPPADSLFSIEFPRQLEAVFWVILLHEAMTIWIDMLDERQKV